MSRNLYLIESRARQEYSCPSCKRLIPRGAAYFRDDPYPYDRAFRGMKTSYWCYECITLAPTTVDAASGRLRVRAVTVAAFHHQRQIAATTQANTLLVPPAQVELVPASQELLQLLSSDPSAILRLSPDQFEEFICDRLYAMGLEPRRIGKINRKDGGIDIVFWPRQSGAFPFLGAAQVKHHTNPKMTEGPSTVREFAGAIAPHAFGAALLVTNTSFSPDAAWFARERTKLVRLREFGDIKRWIHNHFEHDDEWREIPQSIELCPGITINIRGPS